jgi:cell wall-associated NlpC family hydrolase
MDEQERDQRQRFVAAAKAYLGTPYHPGGRVKGAGVDCLTLLSCAAEDAGLIARASIPHYPPDWHLHNGGERYMAGLLKYTHEIAGPPQPGDIALWRFGRSFSHGAIVTEWPRIIHAYLHRCVYEENVSAAAWLNFIGENGPTKGKPRPVKFFSFWHGA